jgi:very-short-patch-repair endonuclease
MPQQRTNTKTFINSYHLRHNQTQAETRLWQALRMHQLKGIHFRRQHAIGPYIVDFVAPKHKLIIELDGSQHMEQQAYDAERTAYLESKGYRVLRFWNNEVMENKDGVLQIILEAIRAQKQ